MPRAGRSRRNPGWTRAAVVSSVLFSMALLPSCGGSGGGGDVTGGGGPVRTVIFEDTWALGVLEFIPLEGNVNVSGTMDVTVDWTFATNDVDVVVTDGSCTDEQFTLVQCPFLASAVSTTAKPERLSLSVTAGDYTVWVVNVGPERESGSIVVGITQ